MFPAIDLNTVRFGRPEYLGLLAAPGLLLTGWLWRLARRRQDAASVKRREVPIHERFPMFGGLLCGCASPSRPRA